MSKCKEYLRFLDCTALEAGIEAKMSERDSEMQAMKQKYDRIYRLTVKRLISDFLYTIDLY